MKFVGLNTALVMLLAGAALCAPASGKVAPIAREPMADPFVYKDGTDWYLFGTMPYLLQGKSLTPEALKKVDLHLDFGPKRLQMWSFAPYKHTDGSYHAYATLHHGYFKTTVGHLVPEEGQKWTDGNPITRWRLDKVLVGDIEKDRFAYDSELIRDTSGDLYLIYVAPKPGGRDNCIWAHRMLDPGNLDPSFEPRTILEPQGLRSEDRNPGGMQLVEAASFIRIAGKWVMCYTVGDFLLDNYKMAVAYSDTLIPPEGKQYQKVLIADRENLWGNTTPGSEVNYILQSQIKGWPNYCRSIVAAPGAGSIIHSRGRYWLVFHGYFPDDTDRNGGDRYSWILPLEVNISDKKPVDQWIRPVLPSAAEPEEERK